jgi:peptidoglycan/LPS O-acetylase OafA/YrhL
MSQTIAERIAATGGRTTGFDYLRIFLAVSVIAIHSTSLSYGREIDSRIWTGLPLVFSHLILPLFFSLSGFLVAGSLERCPTLISFYGLRALRIFPALTVEVVLSAFIFGPILSTLDLDSYFSAREFKLYFLNIFGDIHYVLPGVFDSNPVPSTVNGQLWTVPFELQCYVALGTLAIIGIVRKRSLLLGAVLLGQWLWAWEAFTRGTGGPLSPVNGPVLLLSFLAGVLFFLYRDRIILNVRLFTLSVALCVGLLLSAHGAFLVAIPATYITVYLGLTSPRRVKYLFAGDYSYGLYLYGYPVQQAIATLGSWSHHWYINLGISLPASLLIAYISWTWVEKPALSLKKLLPGIEQAIATAVCGKWDGVVTTLRQNDGVVERIASIALFVAGTGSVFLLLDAHEGIGLASGFMSFVLATLLLRRRVAAARQAVGALVEFEETPASLNGSRANR